jgi:hypothetical protein
VVVPGKYWNHAKNRSDWEMSSGKNKLAASASAVDTSSHIDVNNAEVCEEMFFFVFASEKSSLLGQ